MNKTKLLTVVTLASSLLVLPSCTSTGSASDLLKGTIETNTLLIGSYGHVTDENGKLSDYYLNAIFINNGKEIDYSICLADNPKLINLGDSVSDTSGSIEPCLFYDFKDEISTNCGSTDFKSWLGQSNNSLQVYFNYDQTISQKVDIKDCGIYAFSVISQNGETPTYNHSYVRSIKVGGISL